MSEIVYNDRTSLNPSTMLSPVPVVMVSCGSMEKPNIITLAWVGTINSEPPMVSISIRKERYSHDLIENSGKFAINLVSEDLVKETDYCGIKSGRDVNKFTHLRLKAIEGNVTGVPMIAQSPVNMECTVKQILRLGTHDMYIASIDAVHVKNELMDKKGSVDLDKAGLVAYSHGEYYRLGKYLGFYGFSVAGPEALKRRWRRS